MRLADTIHTAYALFESHRIPGDIIIDDYMAELKAKASKGDKVAATLLILLSGGINPKVIQELLGEETQLPPAFYEYTTLTPIMNPRAMRR